MAVLVLVTQPDEAHPLIDWAAHVAAARSTKLAVLCWLEGPTPQEPEVVDLAGVSADDSADATLQRVKDVIAALVAEDNRAIGHLRRRDVSLRSVEHPSSVRAALDSIEVQGPELFIVGGFATTGDATKNGRSGPSSELLRQSPCDTLVLYSDDHRVRTTKQIVVTSTGDRINPLPLVFASRLAADSHGALTVLGVEEDVGAHALEVGLRELQTQLEDLSMVSHAPVTTRVVCADDPIDGIAEASGDSGLIIVGTESTQSAENLYRATTKPSVAVFKAKPPLSIWGNGGRFSEWRPRIRPIDYVEFYQHLLRGSRWNIDFVMMMGLATVIASLGLLHDSPAVVIGSMLLAPLMTPMIGSGLALMQGNFRLARICLRAIGLGFVVSLVLSYVVGVVTPGSEMTAQLLARTQPNLLDLLIAVFSGIAAAYAMVRPSIAGAVAGVAIATALVPPLSTLGIAIAYGEYAKAFGAAANFVTNVIAIVIGAAMTFRAVGITAAPDATGRRAWIPRVALVLIALALLLAIPLSFRLTEQIRRGKAQPMAFPVTRDVLQALLDRIEEEKRRQGHDVTLILAGRPGTKLEENEPEFVGIVVGSTSPLPRSFEADLARIVRREMGDETVQVEVYCVLKAWAQEGLEGHASATDNDGRNLPR